MGLFDEAPVEREVVRDGHAAAEPPVEFGEGSGDQALPIAVESFHALKQRQTSDTIASPGDKSRRVNLLNWDGLGTGGLFPGSKD